MREQPGLWLSQKRAERARTTTSNCDVTFSACFRRVFHVKHDHCHSPKHPNCIRCPPRLHPKAHQNKGTSHVLPSWRTVTHSLVRDSRSSNRPSGSVVRAFSSSRLWVSRKSAERTRDYTLDRSHLSLPRYTVIYQACPSHQHAQTAFGCTGNSQRLRLRVMA